MNTSAIAPSTQPITPGNHRMSSQDATSADTNFGKLLTREIAERNPQDRQVSASKEPVKQSGNATQTSQDSAENDPTKSTAESEQATADPSTEQLLMMAAQFSSTQPTSSSQETSAASANTMMPAPITEPTINPSMATMTPPLDATKNTVKADNTSASDTSSFNATLGQALNKNFSAEATDNTEQMNAVAPKAATTVDVDTLTAASQNLGEISAEKIQDTRPDLSAALAPIQQAAASHAQSSGASERVAAQVGTPAWNNAISQKVVWMLGNEQQSASLTLNPPDLGPLQVVLSVSSTQANASFYSSQPEVRQALEAALPKLREMLGDAGIQLGQANVNAGSPQHQGTYAEFQPTARITNQTGDTSVLPAPAVANRTHTVKEGLIDTFA